MSLVICSMPQCQTTAGCVCGLNVTPLGGAVPILGAEFVCEVPASLGRVTRLRVEGGKVTAETESGIKMIVPTHRHS